MLGSERLFEDVKAANTKIGSDVLISVVREWVNGSAEAVIGAHAEAYKNSKRKFYLLQIGENVLQFCSSLSASQSTTNQHLAKATSNTSSKI